MIHKNPWPSENGYKFHPTKKINKYIVYPYNLITKIHASSHHSFIFFWLEYSKKNHYNLPLYNDLWCSCKHWNRIGNSTNKVEMMTGYVDKICIWINHECLEQKSLEQRQNTVTIGLLLYKLNKSFMKQITTYFWNTEYQ